MTEAPTHAAGSKLSRRARQCAARQAEAGKLEAAYSKIRRLELELAVQKQHYSDNVQARLAAIAPALEAQETAAAHGLPAHSSSGLLDPDDHTMSSAAKHQFAEHFRDITPSKARRAQRGAKRTPATADACVASQLLKAASSNCSEASITSAVSNTADIASGLCCSSPGDTAQIATSSESDLFNLRFCQALHWANAATVQPAPGIWTCLNAGATPFWPGQGSKQDTHADEPHAVSENGAIVAAPRNPAHGGVAQAFFIGSDDEAGTEFPCLPACRSIDDMSIEADGQQACEEGDHSETNQSVVDLSDHDASEALSEIAADSAACVNGENNGIVHDTIEALHAKVSHSESLIKTLGDQIEELNHFLAQRCELLSAGLSSCGDKVDAIAQANKDAVDSLVLKAIFPKLEELASEVRYVTERESLQGLPALILDLASQIKRLKTCEKGGTLDHTITSNPRDDSCCTKRSFTAIGIQTELTSPRSSTNHACDKGVQAATARMIVDSSMQAGCNEVSDQGVQCEAREKGIPCDVNSRPRWIDLASDDEVLSCDAINETAVKHMPDHSSNTTAGLDACDKAASCMAIVENSSIAACDKSALEDVPSATCDYETTDFLTAAPANDETQFASLSCEGPVPTAGTKLEVTEAVQRDSQQGLGEQFSKTATGTNSGKLSGIVTGTLRVHCCLDPETALESTPTFLELQKHFPTAEAALKKQNIDVLGHSFREMMYNIVIQNIITHTCILILLPRSVQISEQPIRETVGLVVMAGNAYPDQRKTLQDCLNLLRNFFPDHASVLDIDLGSKTRILERGEVGAHDLLESACIHSFDGLAHAEQDYLFLQPFRIVHSWVLS